MQQVGWQGWLTSGKSAGTTGRSLRVEALQLRVEGSPYTGGIECRAHVQNVGWTGFASAGSTCGSQGRGRRVEAFRIRLTGDLAKKMDVWYRVHVQDVGWMGWASNGATAGTEGFALRTEAVQVVLVPRGKPAPGSTSAPSTSRGVRVSAHVATKGWRPEVTQGKTAGTTGKALAVEALRVSTPRLPWSGRIECSAHVQNVGWRGWTGPGSTCGTTGRGLRTEAIRLRLTGATARHLDVWYRVHVQEIGWMGWASNGATAGTERLGRRVEAVQVVVLRKGSPAPGRTSDASRVGYQNPAGTRQIQYGGIAQFGGCGFSLTPGMNGLKVQWVADRLGVSQYHQSMSPLLTSRVKRFQAGRGLPATGVVDERTWTALGLSAGDWTALDCYKRPVRITPGDSRQAIIEAFVATAMEYNGSRYIWGGANRPDQGADCSGLVIQALYSIGINPDPNNTVNHALPTWRSSRNLYDAPGFAHVPISQLQRGDVVFYAVGSPTINHTAVYLGDGRIMNESTSGRVQGLHDFSGLMPTAVRPIP